MTRFSAFGVEIEASVKEELDRAAEQIPAGTEFEREQTARRAARLSDITKGSNVLLVNDVPTEMRAPISILRSLGVLLDVATSTDEALTRLSLVAYEVVISDMQRDTNEAAGIELLDEMRRREYPQPVIFTVGRYEPERGLPPYAFGMTNRVDELLHLVFDVLERTRG
ncbi:response regulator [Streptomyces sp. HD]|uniref:response regulator n=1 Tax=Streptomyces sp. HD TaxID=3020892 RepID=UPI00232DC74C|nr:response regulator [Streptomyces sp. HD]MDC0772551.1 response regulator [Streptomyces sp. HD]